MNLREWGQRWGVSPFAIDDLEAQCGVGFDAPSTNDRPGSEARVQSQIMLESAQRGWILWRNNVGALKTDDGRVVRFGLCNDSKRLNEQFKSGDLIGIKPVVITADMVGTTIGQFVSIECKREGWAYSATGHEISQLKWQLLVKRFGGSAGFVSRVGQL